MKTASYFLFKDGESALAAECENLKVKEEFSSGINKMI